MMNLRPIRLCFNPSTSLSGLGNPGTIPVQLVLILLLCSMPTLSQGQEVSSSLKQSKPLKVFILAGQSNMEGHARISSMDHLQLSADSAELLRIMRNSDGTPRVCNDVWISDYRGPGEAKELTGQLTAGFGARRDMTKLGDKIGPEFTFGIHLQQKLQEPILIIKTAWGGKSIHTDFRPPSAGPFKFNETQLAQLKKQGVDLAEAKASRAQKSGAYYRLMVDHVRAVLKDIKRVYPEYKPELGYQISGFVWFQGWNDMVDGGVYPNRDQADGYSQYSQLLATLIRDLRQDLAAPEMHVVIGVMGVNGPVKDYPKRERRYAKVHQNFRDAMAAPASLPEFKENVSVVLTENYWDSELGKLSDKNSQIANKARQLRKENKGYPGKAGTLSPDAQRKLVDAFRDELLTDRDRKLAVGITNAGYHYLGSAKILGGIGKAFAESMAQGIKDH